MHYAYAPFFDISTELQCILDRTGRLLRVNPAWSDFTGLSTREAMGRDFTGFVPDAAHAAHLRFLLPHLGAGPVQTLSLPCWSAAGTTRWVSWKLTAVPDGEVYAAGCLLPESEADAEAGLPPGERLRALLDNSPDLISRYDCDLKYIFVNKTIRQIRGLPEEAFLGKDLSELAFFRSLLSPAHITQYLDDIRRVFETGETVTGYLTFLYAKQGGSDQHLQYLLFPEFAAGGRKVVYVSGISRDVTASRQAETERQQAYQLLNSIIEGTGEGIVAVDAEKNVLAVNAAARKDFREVFNKDIAVGENVLHTVAYIPNAVDQLGSLWDRALTGDSFQVVQRAPAPLHGERYYESLFFPILQSEGRYLGAASIARDITERKLQAAKIRELLTEQVVLNQQLEDRNRELAAREAELAAVNDELLRQQQELHELVQALENRNFELDQLIYKTSHDIRSPLTSILGILQVMRLDSDPAATAQYLGYIENRVHTLDRFLRSMISYAKATRTEIAPESIQPQTLLAGCLEDLRFVNGFDQVRVSVQVRNPEVPFFSDPFRLGIILSNLISNAIKYRKPDHSDSYLRVTADLAPDRIRLTLADNGIGIRPEYLDKVFNMFFRATEKAEGSGLGLYIVKQTVEKLKGTIRVRSTYGTGTEMEITLPNLKT
ncbi:MAG TPA: PAS domain-containing protein [Cytophagales bacterium]